MIDHPDLLFMLHDVARQLRLDSDRRARAHGMTRAQWIILVRLESQPGLSQKELAEILEVEPITVARLIDRLEDRGMVERRGDPADRRVWRLHLLPPAEPVLRDIHAEREDLRRLVSAGIDAGTLHTINAGLARMKANLMAESRGRALERDVA
ncbi:MAG: MarR family transcriptional regulator [Rhodospirillales bacterium]|nr:MarR family transcriptional regulator [Rhodospirillales bacterium]